MVDHGGCSSDGNAAADKETNSEICKPDEDLPNLWWTVKVPEDKTNLWWKVKVPKQKTNL